MEGEWIRVGGKDESYRHSITIYIHSETGAAKRVDSEFVCFNYHDEERWDAEERAISVEEALVWAYPSKYGISKIFESAKEDLTDTLEKLKAADKLVVAYRGEPQTDVYYNTETGRFWLEEIAEPEEPDDPYGRKKQISDNDLWLKLIKWGDEQGLQEFLKLKPKPDCRTRNWAISEEKLTTALQEIGSEYRAMPGDVGVVVMADGEMAVVITKSEHFYCTVYRGEKQGFSTQEEAFNYAWVKAAEHHKAMEQRRGTKNEAVEAAAAEPEAAPQPAKKRGLFGRRK